MMKYLSPSAKNRKRNKFDCKMVPLENYPKLIKDDN